MVLYHGTDREIKGGVVLPVYGYAHATTELDCAESYGAIVYEVEPADDMEHDTEMGNPEGMDFRSKTGFRIIREI